MHVNLVATALFKSKKLAEYWSNINTATKYSSSEQQPTIFTCIPNFMHG